MVVTVVALAKGVENVSGMIFLDMRPRQLEMDGTFFRKAAWGQNSSGAMEVQAG